MSKSKARPETVEESSTKRWKVCPKDSKTVSYTLTFDEDSKLFSARKGNLQLENLQSSTKKGNQFAFKDGINKTTGTDCCCLIVSFKSPKFLSHSPKPSTPSSPSSKTVSMMGTRSYSPTRGSRIPSDCLASRQRHGDNTFM
jgi:hypothetical protein